MNSNELKVVRWASGPAPDEQEIRRRLAAEKLQPYRWSNGPGDVYSAHQHAYNKVIVVVSGSITFGLPELERQESLQAGDRLELPAGVVHDAVVGRQGVVCLEAHR